MKKRENRGKFFIINQQTKQIAMKTKNNETNLFKVTLDMLGIDIQRCTKIHSWVNTRNKCCAFII